MKKFAFLLPIMLFVWTASAKQGDTTKVRIHQRTHWNWNGSFYETGVLPDSSKTYEKIILKYTLGCPGIGCSGWDYTTHINLMEKTGELDTIVKQAPSIKTDAGISNDTIHFNTSPTYTYYYNSAIPGTDSNMNNPFYIYIYNHPTDVLLKTDSLMAYDAGYYNYLYDSVGTIYDSVMVNPDSTWVVNYRPYDTYRDVKRTWELARYITPYAGDKTVQWEQSWYFDITDYEPLLHDTVEINAKYDGWQDGFTITCDFLFIEGTPPRKVNSIHKLYNTYGKYGHGSVQINDRLKPVPVTFTKNDKSATMKVLVSGHGFGDSENCAEFCSKDYFVKMDGGNLFTKTIELIPCGSNNLYPQTGTWIYDRANWCPGDKVWPHNFVLDGLFDTDFEHQFDVDFEPYTSNDNNAGYSFDAVIFTYGDFNRSIDLEMEEILVPTSDPNYVRTNPSCFRPKVRIRNTGSTPITSAKIIYGMRGQELLSYDWTGSLYSMQSTVVELPDAGWLFKDVNQMEFTASVAIPNNKKDEYEYNNEKSVFFNPAPRAVTSSVRFRGKFNNNPQENVVALKKADGTIVKEWKGVQANYTFDTTMTLGDDCYYLEITDSDCDGLYFPFNNPPYVSPGEGNGYLIAINSNGTQIGQINPNFGCSGRIVFSVGSGYSGSEPGNKFDPADTILLASPEFTLEDIDLNIYPNPAHSTPMVYINAEVELSQSKLVIYDMSGHVVWSKAMDFRQNHSEVIDLSDLNSGNYILELRTNEVIKRKRFILSE
jgi:hypothetical protein